MRLKFNVKNLGKINNAEINLAPLTVITGPNGTGKSFFTKTLYSIFRMAEELDVKDNILIELNEATNRIERIINFKDEFPCKDTEYPSVFLDKIHSQLHSSQELINKIKEEISLFTNNDLVEMSKKVLNLIPKELDLSNIIRFDEQLTSELDAYFSDSNDTDKNLTTVELIKSIINNINMCFEYGMLLVRFNNRAFEILLRNILESEIKDNFQVESLSQIVNGKFSLYSDKIFNLTINDKLDVKIKDIEFFKNRPSSIFFESPAYWRVRDALISAKMKSGNEYLSGVPKYFFDLDEALKKKSKNTSELLYIYESIKSELSGEFIIENGQISYFDDISNKQISKNLVSFGMTNLGMLNALIKNNVIKKGSYVFIDEPETNLHPDWQVMMIKSLVALSQAGVNVVINTHSTEILKYIEIAFSKIREVEGEEAVQELLAVNYLDIDGETLEFDSDCPVEQAKEALSHLSSPFFDLYMQGQ